MTIKICKFKISLDKLLDEVSHQFVETKHYAIFFPKNTHTLYNKLVIGQCDIRKTSGLPSRHAEHAALVKLVKMRNRPEIVNLLVIRFSKSGILGSSRPCYNCIKRLEAYASRYNIKIANIYYSTNDGTIESENLKFMKDSYKTYIANGFK